MTLESTLRNLRVSYQTTWRPILRQQKRQVEFWILSIRLLLRKYQTNSNRNLERKTNRGYSRVSRFITRLAKTITRCSTCRKINRGSRLRNKSRQIASISKTWSSICNKTTRQRIRATPGSLLLRRKMREVWRKVALKHRQVVLEMWEQVDRPTSPLRTISHS